MMDLQAQLRAAIEAQRASTTALTEASDGLERVLELDDATADQIAAARERHAEARSNWETADSHVADLEHLVTARARVPRDLPSDGSDARVTRVIDELYRPDNTTDFSFFRDLARARDGDQESRQRLVQNNQRVYDRSVELIREGRGRLDHMQRAGFSQTAGAGGEFMPPLWLQDFEPQLRAGRAFLDVCQNIPLPDGTNSINVPKVATGATVAVQTDGNAVSNTDLTTTSVTAQVQTEAGRTLASYQSIDLGYSFNDQMIYEDLLAAYWANVDTNAINGNVTNAKGVLNVTGVNPVTYTDATPTAPELYPLVFQAKSQIEKGAFAPVNFSLWHPSTWNWYLSQLDASNRPFALNTDLPAFNMIAQSGMEPQGIAGNFNGIPVVVDANVPVNLGAGTNEARIVLANRRTLYFYEGAPRFKVADQTSIANLQYQFVLYGYYAVAFPRQPKMISVLSGTGLIVQSGF